MERKHWTRETIESCQKATGVPFSVSADSLAEVCRDFGGLREGHGVGVAYPETVQDISALLKYADSQGLGFSVRSAGFSQGGQTLAPPGGATLYYSRMSRVEKPDPVSQTVVCQAGATWRHVTEVTTPCNLMPKVIPFFPDLTVGGVLSIGGVGGNSHLYGCAAKNVQELEVVTGSGDIKTCSLMEEPDLFEATLCGLGRCSIMAKITLELRHCKPRVATYSLVYTEYDKWLADMALLRKNYIGDYLEAFCLHSFQGLHKHDNKWKPLPVWFYNIQVSFEYDREEELARYKKYLETLGHWRLYCAGLSTVLDFTCRYGARTQNIRASGSWHSPRPWFECMLPFKTLSDILPELLNRLPISLNDGLGYRIFFVEKDNNPPSFMTPVTTGPVAGFAAFPATITHQGLDPMLAVLEGVHEWLLSLGGKRYVSGWLGSDTGTFWQKHYGTYYDRWQSLKKKYDPDTTLQSLLLQEAS